MLDGVGLRVVGHRRGDPPADPGGSRSVAVIVNRHNDIRVVDGAHHQWAAQQGAQLEGGRRRLDEDGGGRIDGPDRGDHLVVHGRQLLLDEEVAAEQGRQPVYGLSAGAGFCVRHDGRLRRVYFAAVLRHSGAVSLCRRDRKLTEN